MSKDTRYFLINTLVMLVTEGILLHLLWFGKDSPYFQGLLNVSYVTNAVALVASVGLISLGGLAVFLHYRPDSDVGDEVNWHQIIRRKPSRWVFRAVGLVTTVCLAFAGWWYLFTIVFLTNAVSTGGACALRRMAEDIVEEDDPGIHKPA